MAAAFEIREKDEFLSVNWLEYWSSSDMGKALGCVRGELSLSRRPGGRFAVLRVSQIKGAIDRLTQRKSAVTHQPTPEMESHAGVFGFFQNDREVAAELARIVTTSAVFPAIADHGGDRE